MRNKRAFDMALPELEAESLSSFFEDYKDKSLKDLKDMMNDDIDEMQEDIEEGVGQKTPKFDAAQKDLNKEFEEIMEMAGDDTKLKDIMIPGSEISISEFGSDDMKDDEERERTYEDDRYLPDFPRYVNFQYPGKIPTHDGSSLLGCERAIAWLQRLANEISTSIRNDIEGHLNESIDDLSSIQEKVLTDIFYLKDHMKKLKQMLPEKTKSSNLLRGSFDILKTASTPSNMVISITPFIRAISGILINSTVSAGKPFEDVYEYLLNKYDINEREQLEILQTLMDMGQPIFKDRGTMPSLESADKKELKSSEEELQGVDFITNYFA